MDDSDKMGNSSARTKLVFIDLSTPSEIQHCVVEDAHSAVRAPLRYARQRDADASPGSEQPMRANRTRTSSYMSTGRIDMSHVLVRTLESDRAGR